MTLRILTENGRELQTAQEVRIPGWTEARYAAEAPDQGFFEFKDGELIMHSPVGVAHQRIVGFLGAVLRSFVSERGVGEVFLGPAVLRLREGLDREPDIFFVSAGRSGQVRDPWVEAPVDLVIEITSEGSETRDLEEKRAEYEGAGIPEYWVVDPKARAVHVHVLERSTYRVDRLSHGKLQAACLPGFYVDVEWLWQVPPPPELRCLEEILNRPARS